MTIRVPGKIADHLVGAFIGIVMQEGWDYGIQWLKKQGIASERVQAIPHQLPSNHPYSYYEYKDGYYRWEFGDPQRNLHVKLRWVPYVMTSRGPHYRWEAC